MTMAPWGIHWFRRDLRIVGNTALRENWQQTKGRTLGLFCFDSKFLGRSDFSSNRFAFFLKTLKALQKDLRERGGDLLVIDKLPQKAFPQLLSYCQKKQLLPPSIITWSRDYEPFARDRDAEIEKLLKENGVFTKTNRDHLLFEPHEILKNEKRGEFYQIYSPFARRWFEALSRDEGQLRIASQKGAKSYFEGNRRDPNLFKLRWQAISKTQDFPWQDAMESFEQINSKQVTIPIPEAGFHRAYEQLLLFKSDLQSYKERRDFPSVSGTSRLAQFLKNGSLTVPQIIYELKLKDLHWTSTSHGPLQFLKELVWREFYYSILFHRPDVEVQSFLPHYRNIEWENNEDFFERWKEGTTGFPIVDAGMRELRQTGWMHNRVRMIVASFLTKDLLIDWRWGEHHFMKELLDGDLAPNNGGWQWAASTGCDPQPYFRIFNPWLQGAKFDPDGAYIKTFVSELREAPTKVLHNPEGDRKPWKYPDPIVNHRAQSAKALLLYRRP